ncbi:hypothetical protein [Streptomyces sp. VRA16 Mangrove soil]|uniref:hypothetical protein n=1 Tax=Streptomyces sp. VRA16 Mangrove soil TaxID=2817434 RepID=UPI001A9D2062|nr:hypothetical protein [Streptomyces sp. VRA16 Mangrove soil]MBO1334894.1 hypothetical protein [Streptomyces sp. VRA16 Mangrove soil]
MTAGFPCQYPYGMLYVGAFAALAALGVAATLVGGVRRRGGSTPVPGGSSAVAAA